MKWIKYSFNIPSENEDGTAQDNLYAKALPYSEEALRIAEEEAYGGEYTIEDDGMEEPVIPDTADVSWDEMAAALAEGVNEV